MLNALPRIRPLLIAHRAGNEIALLRRAERLGVDLIELDLWPYRGRLEVRHLKTAGPLPVLWDRWKLSSARTPRLQLAELLLVLDPETRLMIDLKGTDPSSPERLLACLDEHRPGQEHLICSQSWILLDHLNEAPHTSVIYSIGSRRQLRAIWPRLERDDHQAVSIQARLLTPLLVQQLKERVSTVISWPVNSEARRRQLLSWGVDGLISDDLDLLGRWLAERAAGERKPG